MKLVWLRIEQWLAANAPVILESLLPGATDEEILRTETYLDVTFPEAVRESYLIHNGQAINVVGLIGEWELLSLDGIRSNWKTWKYLLDSGNFNDWEVVPAVTVVSSWWDAKWIPLTTNYTGDHYCLDMTSTPISKTGQIISLLHDAPQRAVVASSFRSWLTGFADDLENGAYTYSEEYDELVKTDVEPSS
jgi:cell wall assembly regulator SMI1